MTGDGMDSKAKRAELLRMVRTMGDSCLDTAYWAVACWYRADQDRAAAAELAALKAAQATVGKPQGRKRPRLGGNVVALHPE